MLQVWRLRSLLADRVAPSWFRWDCSSGEGLLYILVEQGLPGGGDALTIRLGHDVRELARVVVVSDQDDVCVREVVRLSGGSPEVHHQLGAETFVLTRDRRGRVPQQPFADIIGAAQEGLSLAVPGLAQPEDLGISRRDHEMDQRPGLRSQVQEHGELPREVQEHGGQLAGDDALEVGQGFRIVHFLTISRDTRDWGTACRHVTYTLKVTICQWLLGILAA